jgi:hypothetical protein
MSIYVIFDPATNKVTGIRESVDPSVFAGRIWVDVLEFLDTTTPTENQIREIVNANPAKYLKVDKARNAVDVMTAEEKQAVDTAEATAYRDLMREAAKETFDSDAPDGKILKAVVLLLIDELNDLRTWVRDFKTQTAAATSLANLQSRVASLPTLNDRTSAQARTAIRAKIDAGAAD